MKHIPYALAQQHEPLWSSITEEDGDREGEGARRSIAASHYDTVGVDTELARLGSLC